MCEVNSYIDIDSKIRESFISYWTEPNKSKTKLKFEMQTTWDLKRRLNTWVENSKTNFGRVKDESNKIEELKRKYG